MYVCMYGGAGGGRWERGGGGGEYGVILLAKLSSGVAV